SGASSYFKLGSIQYKQKIEPKFQIPSDNMAPIYPKVKVPSFQRAISRETVEEIKNPRNMIPSPIELTPKLEIENEWKRKYEELQNKYDMMLKKHDETRLKCKQVENSYLKEKRKNDDLVIENNKLKTKMKELEEKNENLSKNQQTRFLLSFSFWLKCYRTQNRNRHPAEETSI
ncbi:MAG TPA: hypothetical protein PLS50_09175, partial [Candidatus Dojkabacteria bacterium]|nr:hypothetical protein [Candidatus Dojkabacteria bacterium]